MTAISAANIGGSAISITAGSSGATGSIAWGASDKLVLAIVAWEAQTTDNRTISSLAGASLTFTDIGAGRISVDAGGGISLYHQVLRVVGNGNSEAITITFSGTVSFGRVQFVRLSGDMDLGGTNGSNALVQTHTNTGTATTQTNSLNAFGDAVNNAAVASWSTVGASGSSTPGSGWTELHDFDTSNCAIYTEFQLGQDTTPDYTAPGSQVFAGIAVEIKAGTTSTAAAAAMNYFRQMRG